MTKRLLHLFTLLSILIPVAEAQSLTTVSEIYDGTPQDIAAGYDVIYLAQGRNLALLDPETGLRTSNYNDNPYPAALVAVEFDKAADRLFVATSAHIYIHDHANGSARVWENKTGKDISNLKYIDEDQKLVVVISDEVLIMDYSEDEIEVVSGFSVPEGISFFQRIQLADTRNGMMAYLTGAITGQEIRGINGLVIARLDSDNNYAEPFVYPDFWNPVLHYNTLAASVLGVEVMENFDNEFTYAFVAAGLAGQLTVLNVTDPSSIQFVSQKVLASQFPTFKVLFDEDQSRLFVMTMNILHVLDPHSLNVHASINAGFFDGGNRDIAVYQSGGSTYLWTATHFSVDYVINAVDVTTNALSHTVQQWWISSSDGAVAVPEWHSIYLPTFGGIVRYDVFDEVNPVAVNESYRPAGGTIEHIDVIFPDPDSKDYALLLTARGSGGLQYWEVSADEPDPRSPVTLVQPPADWSNDPVYQNDVGYFQKDGTNYFLTDLANRATHEIALQIYNTSTSQWLNVLVQHEELRSNAHSITVYDNYAFVTASGGFFVVDLSQLPHSATVTDLVINDWDNDGKSDDVNALALNSDGTYLFVAHDPGVIQSYAFDASSGTVTGPVDQLYGDAISGNTSRGRYFDDLDRFYVAGRDGNVMEIDARDPYNLELLSVWNNGAYAGEMQDVRIYDFGNGPRVLAVKNNEAFAILEIPGTSSTESDPSAQQPGVQLYANYPNPFGSSTTIRWYSEAGGHTTLSVYDLLGRRVKTLVDEGLPPGSNTFYFSPVTLSSGTYYYEVRVGNSRGAGKMILIK